MSSPRAAVLSFNLNPEGTSVCLGTWGQAPAGCREGMREGWRELLGTALRAAARCWAGCCQQWRVMGWCWVSARWAQCCSQSTTGHHGVEVHPHRAQSRGGTQTSCTSCTCGAAALQLPAILLQDILVPHTLVLHSCKHCVCQAHFSPGEVLPVTHSLQIVLVPSSAHTCNASAAHAPCTGPCCARRAPTQQRAEHPAMHTHAHSPRWCVHKPNLCVCALQPVPVCAQSNPHTCTPHICTHTSAHSCLHNSH